MKFFSSFIRCVLGHRQQVLFFLYYVYTRKNFGVFSSQLQKTVNLCILPPLFKKIILPQIYWRYLCHIVERKIVFFLSLKNLPKYLFALSTFCWSLYLLRRFRSGHIHFIFVVGISRITLIFILYYKTWSSL